MNLFTVTYAQLVDQFRKKYGRGEYHAAALYRAFYHTVDHRWDTLPEFADSPDLRQQIKQDLKLTRPTLAGRKDEDGVCKLVFRLYDGHTIETVVIPMANHSTLCISCQVGCRMGCRFCQTGRRGLTRNLSTEEIVAQVYAVKVEMGVNIRNVVFMGMGEPLDNFDAVTQAVRVMEDQRGLDIAKRHITLSTAGLPHKIEQLAKLNWPRLKLALSLNAPNDTLRTELMPINRRWPLDALKKALTAYPVGRGNAFFIEYVLIRNVNDRPGHARQLADYVGKIPVKLNLIPYNPCGRSPFQAPAREDIEKFQKILIDQKIFVRLRSSKGAGIRAACGQLGGGRIKKSLDEKTEPKNKFNPQKDSNPKIKSVICVT
jgi:23S rRNA (adenine2503-C2)-methyltransferase